MDQAFVLAPTKDCNSNFSAKKLITNSDKSFILKYCSCRFALRYLQVLRAAAGSSSEHVRSSLSQIAERLLVCLPTVIAADTLFTPDIAQHFYIPLQQLWYTARRDNWPTITRHCSLTNTLYIMLAGLTRARVTWLQAVSYVSLSVCVCPVLIMANFWYSLERQSHSNCCSVAIWICCDEVEVIFIYRDNKPFKSPPR